LHAVGLPRAAFCADSGAGVTTASPRLSAGCTSKAHAWFIYFFMMLKYSFVCSKIKKSFLYFFVVFFKA